MTQGRCFTCSKQVEITEGKMTTTKNNRKMMKGKCGTCGGKVCAFVKG